jgi:hypothetical protein
MQLKFMDTLNPGVHGHFKPMYDPYKIIPGRKFFDDPAEGDAEAQAAAKAKADADAKAATEATEKLGWIAQIPEDVRKTLPEDLTKDPNITKYKSVDEFLKGHINAVKKLGEKGIIPPKEGASPEEWEAYHRALGKPEKAEEYKITPVENLHPKLKEKMTPQVEGFFKAEMHKLDIPQMYVDKLYSWYFNASSKALAMQDAAQEKAIKEGETALRAELNDKYDATIKMTENFVKYFGGKDVINALGNLGSHPAIVKMFSKIAANFSEDQIAKFGGDPQATAGAIGEAKSKIKAIMEDKKHAYWNENDPKHKEAIQEVRSLYDIAYPEGGAE